MDVPDARRDPDAPPAAPVEGCPQESPPPERPAKAWGWLWVFWVACVVAYAALSLVPIRFFDHTWRVVGDVTLDEALHFLIFVGLALGVTATFASRLDLFLAMLLLVLLGVATELSHFYIPERAFSLRDMLANSLGVVAGGAPGLAWRLRNRRRRRRLSS